MDALAETLVQAAVIAVTWPIWGPALRLVLRDVREAAESDDDPVAPAPRRPERARVVNAAWDDSRVGRRRGSRLRPEPRDGFVSRP